MIHIRGSNGYALCDDGTKRIGVLVTEAAMHSDCDKCRALVKIAPINQRGCAAKPPLLYERERELLDRNGKPYERDKL